MRKAGLVFTMLVLATGLAIAQQELAPSLSDGPMNIKPAPPRPGSDGVYSAGPGIVAPIVIQRAQAAYPADAPAESIEGECVVSMIVGVDGVPTDIRVVRTHGASFDTAATEAVRQSTFQPGTIDGKPVPVRMFARTRFYEDLRPTFPRILMRFGQPMGTGFQGRPVFPILRGDTPPRVLNTVEPAFTEEARRKKIQGIVMISVLVNEEGMPIDPKVTRPLDPGLDEKAIECVLEYRFRPAMHEGTPVATRITVEINFRLY